MAKTTQLLQPIQLCAVRPPRAKQIVPGLMFLGTGTKTELLGKAEAEGIDFVFFFDVDVENKRMGPAK